MLPDAYKNVDERTAILNKDSDKRSVLDSIDRPIRPLVLELNRIGLTTVFSCCGYTYEGQEEPKSHDRIAYVLFRVDYNNPRIVSNFFSLAKLAPLYGGWCIGLQANGVEWSLFNKSEDSWIRSDNLPEAIHQYELKLINITKLAQGIKALPSLNENDSFVLRDGNELRRSVYGEEWMVVPKQPTSSWEIKIKAEKLSMGRLSKKKGSKNGKRKTADYELAFKG